LLAGSMIGLWTVCNLYGPNSKSPAEVEPQLDRAEERAELPDAWRLSASSSWQFKSAFICGQIFCPLPFCGENNP
jgi:hypothetical protein